MRTDRGCCGPGTAPRTRPRVPHPPDFLSRRLLRVVGPGLLVAATGVGAGDLATGALVGSRLGVAVLWAALVGAFFKFVLTEGLARWQLATGQTLLEGAILRFGPLLAWAFGLYLAVWTFQVGAALIAACGVASLALLPLPFLTEEPARGVAMAGAAHSAVALGLVWLGGFRLFERLMGVAVGVMFAVAVVSAALVAPDPAAVAAGLALPSVPDAPGAVGWTVALMGGVGGTLTILCYGYWIREEGREGPGWLRATRLDLAVAYLVTAVFSVSMVILGSGITLEGGGAGLLVALGDHLGATVGPTARVLFLVGAWAAVFSSLLGVWQATPYLFADFWGLARQSPSAAGSGGAGEDGRRKAAGAGREAPAGDGAVAARRVDTRGAPYRGWLLFTAIVPLLGVLRPFADVQRAYAVFGALVMPGLAALLLVMNGREAWVAGRTNRPATVVALVAVLAFFAWVGGREAWSAVAGS